jgi:zinc transporter 1/2/3
MANQVPAVNLQTGGFMLEISDTEFSKNHQSLFEVVGNSTVDHGALTTARIVSMVVLGLISFLIGMLPVWIAKMTNIDVAQIKSGTPKIILSMLLCFGAGVLLCTSFAHILPELRVTVESLQESGDLPTTGDGIPLPEIFVLSGFFAVYLVEEMMHVIYGDIHSAGVDIDMEAFKVPRDKKSMFKSLMESSSGMIFALALSFHAIFEGLAVGLANNATEVWYLMGAVAAHKFVISFCLGVEYLVTGIRRLLLTLYIAIFSIATPVGIGIGIALTSESNTDTVATTVLEGMAAGTLLYVVFLEVLQRERTDDKEKRSRYIGAYQLLAVTLGFLVMLGLFNAGEI